MQDHKNTLVLEEDALQQLIAWKSFARYGLWAILVCFLGVSGWFGYVQQIWLTQPANFGTVGH